MAYQKKMSLPRQAHLFDFNFRFLGGARYQQW